MSDQKRIHGLDALRGVAMILGIFLHGAISYKAGFPYGELIHDEDAEFYFFDWFHLMINSFRMQLFFLLAGFFASLLLRKIGLWNFIKNRFNRVAVPFVFAYFTILPATLVPVMYYYNMDNNPWFHVKDFLVNFYTLRQFSGLIHLWFLYDLLIFYSVSLSIYFGLRVVFKMRYRISTPSFLINPVVFTPGCILMAGLISQLYDSPVFTIWTGLITPPAQLLYYGFFFALGWFIENNRILLNHFNLHYKTYIGIGIVLSLINAVILNFHFVKSIPELQDIAYRFSVAIQTTCFVFGLVGLFNVLFSEYSNTGRYLATSAFWVYLIHNPVVLATQLLLLDSFVPPVLRFPVVIIVAIIVSYATYHYMVRNTWIGVMLNGRRMNKS